MRTRTRGRPRTAIHVLAAAVVLLVLSSTGVATAGVDSETSDRSVSFSAHVLGLPEVVTFRLCTDEGTDDEQCISNEDLPAGKPGVLSLSLSKAGSGFSVVETFCPPGEVGVSIVASGTSGGTEAVGMFVPDDGSEAIELGPIETTRRDGAAHAGLCTTE